MGEPSMADPVTNGAPRTVPPIVRTARPVALKIQQEIKSAVHHGLIKRLDLEKIAQMHENPSSQQQLLTGAEYSALGDGTRPAGAGGAG
jgi:hypothetical protein